MTPHERKQLLLALRSARTTRTHAHNAWVAHRGNDGLESKLQKIHAEACAIEAEVRRTLEESREAA